MVYLAEKHENSILKLRFILDPFTFVFLLSGNHQFHIVVETLDTEEATYVWHIQKDIISLKENYLLIDEQLNTIRTKGRQFFLGTEPKNFSRIIHDYSDERKVFVLWKNFLEEKLF